MTVEPAAISFDYDVTQPLDVKVIGIEQRDGVNIQDLTFAAPSGERVPAFLVLPPDSTSPASHPGVLWVHLLEPSNKHSNRLEFVDEAVLLARQGVISVLPDCFWSTTPAKAQGKGTFGWQTNFEHDRDLSIRQVIELRRALDLLLAQPNIDPTRIAYVGHDFGAMYGAIVAAVDRRAMGYILMAGTYSFGDWFTFGSRGRLTEQQVADYVKQIAVLDPTRFVAQAAPANVFFQFAHADYFIPERAAQVFYDAASDPKEIRWYDAAHDLEDMRQDSRNDRLTWLRTQLGLPAPV